ncbi:hypothetical protein [Tyzzerella sp. An114]|nr:hypothetical protein [Tyzzerella sp. An114]
MKIDIKLDNTNFADGLYNHDMLIAIAHMGIFRNYIDVTNI